MNEEDSPPPSEKVMALLASLANEWERMLTPTVDASLAGLAEVAFVQGTLGPHTVRDATVPASTGHHLHVCLDILRDQLRGMVTVELLSGDGTVLRTEHARVNLPNVESRPSRRRPQPLGIINLLFPVPAEVDWGAVVSARLSWRAVDTSAPADAT